MEGKAPPEPSIENGIAAGMRRRLAGGSPSISKRGSPEALPPFPNTARRRLALHYQTSIPKPGPPTHPRYLRSDWIEVSDSGRNAEPTTSFFVIFVNFCKSGCCV